MTTSSEQYSIEDQKLFDSDHSESEQEEENEEDEDEDEADEIYEEEENIIEAEDLGKYFYDLTQMCTANGYIFISGLEISEDLIKGLRLFYIKEKHNLTETAFNDILREMDLFGVSLYKLRKILEQLVPLEPILIDCCIDSCIAFTKEYETLEYCPICEKT